MPRRVVRRGGRGSFSRDGRGRSGEGIEARFEATAPEESRGFDDLGETKQSKKQEKLSNFSFMSAFGADDKQLEDDLDALDVRSPFTLCTHAHTVPL